MEAEHFYYALLNSPVLTKEEIKDSDVIHNIVAFAF
eukprot:gene23265-9571_t